VSVLALVGGAFALQAVAMALDEGIFHRRRGLPRWERIGHPLDSATVLACYAWLLGSVPTRGNAFVYAGLAGFSSLFVTKDEPIHMRRCEPGELRLHALLFLLHPAVLLGAGWIWWNEPLPLRALLIAGAALTTAGWMVFQTVYWNLGSRGRT
jgi:hypothetical protein